MSYSLEPLTLSDGELRATERLLATVFPSAKHLNFAYLDWHYRQNPEGRAVGFNAYLQGELVAHYTTAPTRAKILGVEEAGVLSLNTATHPAHTGKGLFTRLASLTYDAALVGGYKFVVGVANQNSTHGFVKKLDFTLVAPLDLRITSRAPTMTQAQSLDYQPVWTERALAWRLASPRGPYICRDRDGGVVAICGSSEAKVVQYVLDYFSVAPSGAGALRRSTWFGPLQIWAGLKPGLRWPGLATLPIPLRFRPAPLNLIFRDLTGQKRKLRPDFVAFSGLDFDPY